MKKLTTVALMGAMAVSSATMASQSRWNGFGLASQFIADVQDMWTLPGVVASNADATYMEFGAGSGTDYTNFGYNNIVGSVWGGANGKVGPGVLAIWGGRPYTNMSGIFGGYTVPNDNGGNGNTVSTGFATPSQMIDLIYAWNLDESITLGLGVNRAVAGTSTETVSGGVTTVTSSDASDLGLNIGAEIKEVGPIALLEVGLQYNMLSATNRNDDGSYNNKITLAGTDLNIRVGGDIKGEKGAFQRVELGFGMESANFKTEPATAPAAGTYVESKNSDMSWLLGWAMGMGNDKGMGLGGFILTGMTQNLDQPNDTGADEKETYATSSINLSYVLSGEAKLKDWLSARAGFSSSLWAANSDVYEAGPSGSTVKTSSSNPGSASSTISTGLSWMIGDITVDGVLNQDLLYTGSYLVSGIPAGLFSQVSATWAWGGAKE